MTPPGHVEFGPGSNAGTFPHATDLAPEATFPLNSPTYESLPGVPASRILMRTGGRLRSSALRPTRAHAAVAASPQPSPGTREDGVEQATLARRGTDDPRLSEDELRLLAQIATGVTADVAARKLELSARTLRRRLRSICDRLDVNTPIEAVVWAARRQLI
jgi:DNA-binding CsgD family transcriptional regulator